MRLRAGESQKDGTFDLSGPFGQQSLECHAFLARQNLPFSKGRSMIISLYRKSVETSIGFMLKYKDKALENRGEYPHADRTKSH